MQKSFVKKLYPPLDMSAVSVGGVEMLLTKEDRRNGIEVPAGALDELKAHGFSETPLGVDDAGDEEETKASSSFKKEEIRATDSGDEEEDDTPPRLAKKGAKKKALNRPAGNKAKGAGLASRRAH